MLIVVLQRSIDGCAVSAQHGAGFHDRSHERLNTGSRLLFNLLKPNPTEPFGLQNFHGDHHDSLGGPSLPAFAHGSVTSFTNGKIALIDLDDPFETFPSGPNHRTTETVQDGPGGLITAKPQDSLQTQSAHSGFLARQMPRRCQPHLQGRACLIENRAGCHCPRMSAGAADQAPAAAPIRVPFGCATGTDEPLRPTQPLKIARTLLLGDKPVFKLAPRPRVVDAGGRGRLGFAHTDIFSQVVLSG